MKVFYKISLMLVSMITFFTACKKDEKQSVYIGGTNPVLTATTNTVALTYANRANQAIKFVWTNPNYMFNTGVNSQDVSYILEIDTLGKNFTSANRVSVSISKDLSTEFTIDKLNGLLLNQMQLVPDVKKTFEARVISTLASTKVVPLMSNVISFTATPFAIPPAVNPPASNALYITGSAVPSDWTNAPPNTQKFTRESNTLYTLTVSIIGGQSFLFLPDFGSWNAKYGSATVGNNTNDVNGGDIKDGGTDFKAPAASGTYKIVVDFQRGKYTITKL